MKTLESKLFLFLIIFLNFPLIVLAVKDYSQDLCPPDSFYKDGYCYSCPPNSYFKDGFCYCKEGYLFDETKKSCVDANLWCQSRFGLNTYWNNKEKDCYCKKGYLFDKDENKCIEVNIWCQNKYGINSYWNNKENTCYCKEGYVFDEDTNKCIDGNIFCQSKFGLNSYYDTKDKKCNCKEGYIINDTGTECISKDLRCQSKFGMNSYYDEKDKICHCKDGYAFNKDGTKCITYTEVCKEIYGDYMVGNKGRIRDTASCNCIKGYTWSIVSEKCIPEYQNIFEPFKLLIKEGFSVSLFLVIISTLPIIILLILFLTIFKKIFNIDLSLKALLVFLGLGILTAVLSYFAEMYYLRFVKNDSNLLSDTVLSHGGSAFIEEFLKFSIVYLTIFISRKIKYSNKTTQPIEVVIFMIITALGFALIENFSFISQNFYSSNNNLFVLSLLRFLSANLLHAISSGIIGFGWFLKLVSKKNKYLYVGIFLGTLLHAIYNISIVKSQGLSIFLAICILPILMFIMIRLLKKFKSLTENQNYESKLG